MSNYDAFTRVSTAQTLVGETSVVSTDSIPLAVAPGPGGTAVVHDIGSGIKKAFTVTLTQAIDGDAGDLSVDLIIASNAALSSSVLALLTVTIPNAFLTLGQQFDVPIPPLTRAYLAANGKTHMGLRYRPASAPATGSASAWIGLGQTPGAPRQYSANYRGPA